MCYCVSPSIAFFSPLHCIFLMAKGREVRIRGRKIRQGGKEVKRIKKSGGTDMESWRPGK